MPRCEIGLAAVIITLVDVAVYLPIALMPGLAGEFIRPFALVIVAATLTSLSVSFALKPTTTVTRCASAASTARRPYWKRVQRGSGPF